MQKLVAEKFPNSHWHEYEPVDFDVHRQAATQAFGRPVTPYFKIDEADVVVSLDSDFIGTEENLHITIRQFAKRRKTKKAGDPMSRLYAVEGLMTLTGANADHRLRVPGSMVPAIAARLATEILGAGSLGGGVDGLAKSVGKNEAWVVACAKDLKNSPGKCLVLAGHRQPLAVHLLANAINGKLGNIGKTVLLLDAPENKAESISDLAQSLNAGKVETLVILGGNPAYNAPADLKWAEAQSKAKTVVRLGCSEDESFPTKGLSIPQAHYLESWGDARTSEGTLVAVQPLIEPLFGGWTELEVIARIAGLAKTSPYDIVRETIRSVQGAGAEEWKKFLC